MQFTTSFLATILAISISATPVPLEPRQSALKSWEITTLNWHSPSGRPGLLILITMEWRVSVNQYMLCTTGSYPWQTLTANITDPNEIQITNANGRNYTVPAGGQGLVCLSSVSSSFFFRDHALMIRQNCEAKWFSGESPLGRTWPCDPTGDGYWVMNVLEGSSAFTTSDFNVKFTRKINLLNMGQQFQAQYEATANFGLGKNLGIICGASGVCSYYMKEDSRPVLATQKKQ